MPMRLHYHPASPYSLKAYSAVLHRGDTMDFHAVDVRGGELTAPTFRALSPFGKIPVLEKEQGPLIESTSIIEYLEERGPRVLLPPGSERVARHFDRLGDLYLVDPMSTLWFRPRVPEAERTPEFAAAAWGLFAQQLAHRPFVTGDRFTLGDLSGAIGTEYLERLGVQPPEPIRAWKARCFETLGLAQAFNQTAPILVAMLSARARTTAGS
ncbi:glutathione S-transferase family protein [Pyxidicoccus sp. MSG2]|uniref:glutathione S-transferase family protein n=1 Tax=Pyxidicoccus sp. MSG2 TaxID=2996790 RepID=UPI00226F9C72|nr:glutathione S-transferase family protein [Pyxidicoccus sp. MSG2]MCY1021102.1 glutathione S-transferase family protein [Pyxidicoccus sp. MSG2]